MVGMVSPSTDPSQANAAPWKDKNYKKWTGKSTASAEKKACRETARVNDQWFTNCKGLNGKTRRECVKFWMPKCEADIREKTLDLESKLHDEKAWLQSDKLQIAFFSEKGHAGTRKEFRNVKPDIYRGETIPFPIKSIYIRPSSGWKVKISKNGKEKTISKSTNNIGNEWQGFNVPDPNVPPTVGKDPSGSYRFTKN